VTHAYNSPPDPDGALVMDVPSMAASRMPHPYTYEMERTA
jgi:hypothetical protein